MSAALLALGARLALGVVPTFFVSDALVPIQLSLTHWDPYYWGQARYGMLVPLIALPLREPLANYLFQNWITSMFGVAAFFLLARCLERGASAVAIGAWSFAGFLAVDSQWCHSFYLSTVSQYGTGLSLGLLGVLAWRDGSTRRRFVGAVLLVLALWVDISVPLLLVPLAIGLWVATDSALPVLRGAIRNRTWTVLVSDTSISCVLFLSAAMILNAFVVRTFHTPDNDRLLGFVAFADWTTGVVTLAARFEKSIPVEAMLLIAVVSAASLIALAFPRSRAGRRRGFRVATVLAMLVMVRFAVLGTSRWVHENGMDPKYLIPCRLLLFVLPAYLATRVLLDRAPRSWIPTFAAAGLAASFLMIELRYPFVTWAAARRAMDSAPGLIKYAGETEREGCTHFVGHDQTVWATTFYLGQLAYEGTARKVVGIAAKSDPARVRWSMLATPGFKMCAPIGDPQVELLAETLHWPALELERRLDTIDIWRAKGGAQ